MLSSMGLEQSQGGTISGFVDVDRASNPNSYVAYLERLNRYPGVWEYKQKSFELLELSTNDSVLDVGCGVGADVRTILVLPNAPQRLVGIDASHVMVKQAISAIEPELITSGRILFLQSDVHNLPFSNEAFDASRADRVFQYLEDPKQALREMIRVTKPGGRIVIINTSWEELQMNGVDEEIVETVRAVYRAIIPNPSIVSQLPQLCKEEGLADLVFYQATLSATGFRNLNELTLFDGAVVRAVNAHAITQEEANRSLASMQSADARLQATLPLSMARGVKV